MRRLGRDERRLGRDEKGFPSPDHVLTELDQFDQDKKTKMSRARSIETSKIVDISKYGTSIIGTLPTFEGSFSITEQSTAWSSFLNSHKDPLMTVLSVDHANYIHRNTEGVSQHSEVVEDVRRKIENTPNFAESFKEIRHHMQSPQFQNALTTANQSHPHLRGDGRFVAVTGDAQDGDFAHDYLDLETGNWAEFDPKGFFPS